MFVKKHILTPGPTPVPEEVMLEMAKPLIHHRTPQASEVIKRIWENLKYVFQTKNPVFFLASSGTGAMETAVSNVLSKGDRAVVISGGKFGERWAEICRAYDIDVVEVKVEYGEDYPADELKKLLEKEGNISAVFTEYSETSTGVLFDVKGYAEITRQTSTLLVVDAITAVGVVELKTDEWGIDVVVGGSQKSFMLPPGLSFITFSERAWKKVESSNLPKYYFNILKEKDAMDRGTTAWTPAISLLIGLDYALQMIKDEGLEEVIKRHSVLAEATREGVKAIGLEVFPKGRPSNSVTAVKVPDGIDGKKIPSIMRDRYGVTIAGGQGKLKGKIFRIGHIGYFDKSDIIIALQALEFALRDLGYSFEAGASVKKAQEILLEKYKV